MEDRRISYRGGNFSSVDLAETEDTGKESVGDGTRVRSASAIAYDIAEPKASNTKAAKAGRRGRRHAKIKDVPNLAAAAAAASPSKTAAQQDAQVTGAQSATDDSQAFDDAAAAVSASLGAETAAEKHDRDHSVVDDPTPTFADHADSLISSGFSSSVLQEDATLQIADVDDAGSDSLDLAEFVIQAAVAGEDDEAAAPQATARVEADMKPAEEAEKAAETSAPAMLLETEREAAQAVAHNTTENPLDGFGADTREYEEATQRSAGELASETRTADLADGPAAPALSETAPEVTQDKSLDLRIPIIDEDDIPSIEAAYEYAGDLAAAEQTGDRYHALEDSVAFARDDTRDEAAVATFDASDRVADPDIPRRHLDDGEDVTSGSATDEPTRTLYPTAFARSASSGGPAQIDATDDSAYRSADTDKGEGARDVDAGRLFSALSLKRLIVPPHVFEARQRVNIISGLAIIGALGFVGWYFSSPAPFQQQTRLVEAKPQATETASRKTASPVRPATDVRNTDPKAGLIYQPLKKVEMAALTAIGDLEFKITPSKFHRVVRVVKGDTFVKVLVRAGVEAREANLAIRSMRSIYDPRKLRIGREIKVAFGVAGAEQTRFLGYRFDSSFDRSVHVARQQSGEFAAAEVKKKVSKSYSRVNGQITTSLFGSGIQAGAPAQTMVQLISLFSFAVDFQRDLRGGEEFKILFRSHRDESGRVVRTGEIIYASLTVRGRQYQLYMYQDKKGGQPTYLNEDGQGNRKALMKTPIDGARLTSNFGMRRHPILGYSKLHTGVDFGARTGTPIFAAGDGTIVKIGWFGGYGRYIRIRHGKVYHTAYAHMSRFRGGLKVGSRVKQGETIGYVGTTGRSTGPHLHYEVIKNGKHVNPMTITLPARKRLQGRALKRFLAYRKKIDAQYAGMKNERQKRDEGRVQTVKSEGGAGCKNGIRINPLDKRPCN